MLVLPVYGRRMTGRRSFPEESAVGVGGFVREDTPTAEVDRREAVMASLTGTVRELIDATIRTTVDDDEGHRIRDDLAALVARLRTAQLPGPAGIRYNAELRSWNWGNAVMGAAIYRSSRRIQAICPHRWY